MHFSSCMSGISERLQLTKEQLSTIEKFINELRDMRKVTKAESLDKIERRFTMLCLKKMEVQKPSSSEPKIRQ
ncbi:MAG: hypothetical protein IPK11_15825 [Ignavibacteria bacterium]|nr:hypothetical protein [Ignavibacteria bacterium]